jgi:hypothetical protein
MRSFDLFETLCAARNKAGEDEIEDHFGIAENCAKVQPGDIVVSEYEDYRRDKARKILDNVGLQDTKLITTEDGKSKGTIWASLPDVTEHLDDNSYVLSKLPRTIQGIQTTLHDFTANEKYLLPNFPGLAKAMREARLRTSHPQFRELQLAQIESNFPMLYLASLLLHKRLTDETVLMSSRDCYLWLQLMQFIGAKTNAKYRPEYFLTSRICREFPSVEYIEFVKTSLRHAVIVDLTGTGRSLSLLLQRVGRPDVPVYLLVQYDRRYMEQAYGAVQLGNITALTKNGHANLERANLAPHAMYDNSGSYNPLGIDWENKLEILVQEYAFQICIDALDQYPLDLEATEDQIQAALQQTFKWIRSYDKAWDFASQFLRDEDDAVMARLKVMKPWECLTNKPSY